MNIFRRTNELDVTLKTQFLRSIISHIKISFFMALFFGVCLVNLWTIDIIKKVLCVLIPIIYIFYMAGTGNSAGIHDQKDYSKTRPFVLKGFLLSLPVLALNLVFWLIFKLCWIDTLTILSVLGKLVFYAWTFPFVSFIYTDGAQMDLVSHLLLYILPFFSIGIGYFAGYKKWDIYKNLDAIAFEKKQ